MVKGLFYRMQERIKVVILIIVASVDSRPIMWMEGPEEYVLQVSFRKNYLNKVFF